MGPLGNTTQIKRALISVSDKTGITDLCQMLFAHGVEIISTGNTAKLLKEHNILVTLVEDYTDYPEMLDGRVKTLHPKIHAGILGRHDIDTEFLKSKNIPAIDLVVVNLYPFADTVKKNAKFNEIIENIDIGGPTLIRAAAKNFKWCTVLVCPEQYDTFAQELANTNNNIRFEFRKEAMRHAFRHTSQYDKDINNYFNTFDEESIFPQTLHLKLNKKESLRYGENPHQKAAVYAFSEPAKDSIIQSIQIQGKELSFNNINDSDTALECVKAFNTPTCVIVKHANPCGVATHEDLLTAYQKAYQADPESAFGGIIAFNQKVNQNVVETILEQQFVEVIIAPDFSEQAILIAKHKPNVRLLRYNTTLEVEDKITDVSFHNIKGGLLLQTKDEVSTPNLEVVTKRQPSQQECQDCLFAWNICHFVKSNAIVLAKNGQTLGIGAGQTSRIFSSKIAKMRAQAANLDLSGCVMSSDAFFPFSDNLNFAKEIGVSVIIQPGGAMRDAEIIQYADELNIAMIFTGTRHFRH